MQVEMLSCPDNDLTVVNAARVSYNRWSYQLTEADAKLIEHLAREGDKSPFYHPQIRFRICAPLFVCHQLLRHHVGVTPNQLSRRFTTRDVEFYRPLWNEWRVPDPNNKQSSIYPDIDIDIDDDAKNPALWGTENTKLVDEAYEHAVRTYWELLERGVAREQARMVLPTGMMTTWIWTGSLYAFWNICQERLHPNAQAETRAVAQGIADNLATAFPLSWKHLNYYQGRF